MADSDQRPVESLWFKHLEDIDEVYEDERKAYSLDLSYLSLVPGSIKLNGVASLVDQQGLTKFDKRGLLRRVKQPYGSSAAAPILVTGRPEAVAAQPPEVPAGDVDESPRLVQALLDGLGAVSSLPRDVREFAVLLQGTAGMKIPVAASAISTLQTQLSPDLMQLLQPVRGFHAGVSFFTTFLLNRPHETGRASTTLLAMQTLFNEVLSALSRYSKEGIVPKVRHNLTERGSGSTSGAVGARLRPDLMVIVNSCTSLLGEDKEEDCMQKALSDMKGYVEGGLPATQYGNVPGLPAYAASGLELQFLFITRQGQVQQAGVVLNLGTLVGRLLALRAAIHCYRLVVAIQKLVPPLVERKPLWLPEVRDDNIEVTLTPRGAIKTIRRFKGFARKYGVSEQSLRDAYQVAATAAKQQRDQGQPPYIVTSITLQFTRNGFEVSTTPLGYKRDILTVADAQRLATSCLRTASALHEAGLVYTDFRKDNTVWLDDEHCMVIDLETCRLANQPLPEPVQKLRDWDDDTLELRESGSYFTPTSDLYQIGKMLQPLQPVQQSRLANEFVRLLMSKEVTAAEALHNTWLQADAVAADGD